ncbi:hypothetical protein BDZ91DRAFT_785495 [Kalaharituber pfeilii]|nr:hypothetical protein BDZ91DRAFT_785495 [Kalaharituber pfeilii]
MPIDELDPDFLRSPFFKIILKPACETETTVAHTQDMIQSATLRGSETGPTPRTEYFIHKALLASFSNVLHKHVNNDMREGQEGIMELNEVDEETLKGFLLWAYTKEYRTPDPKSLSSLLYHTKLYALADRFNVVALSDLSYSKITSLLPSCGVVTSPEDITSIVSAIGYAWDNLPLSTIDTTNSYESASTSQARPSGLPSERLLRYFTQYSAWGLDALRHSREFLDLLSNAYDFAVAVVVSSRAAEIPPWGCSPTTASSTGVYNILDRRCKDCGYTGAMKLGCSFCGLFNVDFGGDGRIIGARTAYEYTCGACGKESSCRGEANVEEDATVFGGIRYGHSYLLRCSKCNVSGAGGHLELIWAGEAPHLL